MMSSKSSAISIIAMCFFSCNMFCDKDEVWNVLVLIYKELLYSILVRLTFATSIVPVLRNDGLHTVCNKHRVFLFTSVPFKVNVTASLVRFFYFFSIECLSVRAIAKATCCTTSCAC